MRRVGIGLLCVLLAIVLGSECLGARTPTQPHPPHPGRPAPELEAAYRAVQSNGGIGDEEKVKDAIQTYLGLKAQSLVLGEALDLGIVIDQSVESGRNLCSYELGLLEYRLFCWKKGAIVHIACTYDPIYHRVEISGTTARVTLDLSGLYSHEAPVPPALFSGEPHTITLNLSEDGWLLLTDDYRNEAVDCFPPGTDFAALEASYDQRTRAREREEARMLEELVRQRASDLQVGTLSTYSYMNRVTASNYGKTYSDDAGYVRTNYNYPAFYEWCTTDNNGDGLPDHSDCQNFASQCVWSGFGGTNSGIESHVQPMVKDVSGAADWWCDGSSSGGYTGTNWSWTGCTQFRDMAISNRSYDKIGVQGYSAPRSEVDLADLVYHWPNYEHVLVVVGRSDTNGNGVLDYAEIYVSAHSYNHCNYPLHDVYEDENYVRYFRIQRYRIS